MQVARVARGSFKPCAVARPLGPPLAVRRTKAVFARAVAVTLEAPAAAPPSVHLLTPENFDSFLEENKAKLVVVDFYTDWCGPCKMVAPELERMANASDSARIVFAKLNCGKDNDSKRLAMKLQIKALPTFKLYKHGEEAGHMTGAKVKALQELIDKQMNA